MLYDLYQQSQINDAKAAASRVEGKQTNLQEDLRRLEQKVASLALGCQAMWELLSTHTQLGEQDIVSKMQEIDLRDGREDGKMGGVQNCSMCGRPTSRRRNRCIYCGAETKGAHVFDV